MANRRSIRAPSIFDSPAAPATSVAVEVAVESLASSLGASCTTLNEAFSTTIAPR